MKAFLLVCLLALISPVLAADPAPESVRGSVVNVAEGGVLLDCRSEHYVNNTDQTAGLDLKEAAGTVFLFGHPKQKELIDDQFVGVIAVRAGIYRYKTVLGADKSVAAYKFVSAASKR